MLTKLTHLYRRAKEIGQTEGLLSLIKRSFVFLSYLFSKYIFKYGIYYLYEHTVKERDEAEFLPKLQDITLKVITTNKEADELATGIGVDFRLRFGNARRALDKGAIAFCFFANRELAHMGWIAMSEEAKNTFDPLPYKVDFQNKQACTGGTVTIPKFRKKGLMKYGYFKRFEYLRGKGILTSRNAVSVHNIASQKAHAKFGAKVLGKGRYLRILWWKFWKEMPLALGHDGAQDE